jgi:hypothetical protein
MVALLVPVDCSHSVLVHQALVIQAHLQSAQAQRLLVPVATSVSLLVRVRAEQAVRLRLLLVRAPPMPQLVVLLP